jgi:hypothetical protein
MSKAAARCACRQPTQGRGKRFVTTEIMVSERSTEAIDRVVPRREISSSGWAVRRSGRSRNSGHQPA